MKNLDKHRLRALSGLFNNYSQVFLASLVIPAFSFRFDFYKIILLILGIFGTIYLGYLSLKFAQQGKL